MTAKNDITGDKIKSRVNTQSFDENFDRIFGKKKKYSEDFHDDDQREKALAQNGNVGYEEKDILGQ